MSPVQNPGSEPVKRHRKARARPSAVSGGAATFSPSDLADLELWLRTDSITGLNDGDAVGTWSDESGNGIDMTQSTSSKKPTYKTGIAGFNGRPVVRFDGADDYLKNLTAGWQSSATAGMVFAVVRYNTISATLAATILASYDTSGSNDRFIILMGTLLSSISKAQITQRDADTQDTVRGDTSITTATTYIEMMASTGSAYKIRLNGAEESLSVIGGADNGDWWAAVTGADNVTLGANQRSVVGDETDFLNGDVGEVIVTSSYSTDDRDQVEAYLASRWGVTLS